MFFFAEFSKKKKKKKKNYDLLAVVRVKSHMML